MSLCTLLWRIRRFWRQRSCVKRFCEQKKLLNSKMPPGDNTMTTGNITRRIFNKWIFNHGEKFGWEWRLWWILKKRRLWSAPVGFVEPVMDTEEKAPLVLVHQWVLLILDSSIEAEITFDWGKRFFDSFFAQNCQFVSYFLTFCQFALFL